MGKLCIGHTIGRYTTLQAAQTACSNNDECGCIFDSGCDGGTWLTIKGYEVTPSPAGSCAWTPSKLKLPFVISMVFGNLISILDMWLYAIS